ncbi:PTS fructose transporter subunit IIA [Jeongeupia sp. HS-3]|uniref:PTS sugar transporter subunit IIA n=1 Tax=Jeongeupia sp. HS-3 TaxID=1009682 RepID=UPI0018A52CC9|nr:PTS fructose transporter subunit IIA [Jeongeupia sp. HS-3]BCL75920.1 PTS fructose transporter subunit IIA [Jeongeupia sp. HS-3]
MTQAVSEILTLTHGGWGANLIDCLKMVAGEIHGVSDIALMPVDTMGEFYETVKAKVASMPAGSLIIADFTGGSTSNVAARLSADFDIGVITGLNATLMLAALDMREEGRLADQVDDLVDVGRNSFKNIVKSLQQR